MIDRLPIHLVYDGVGGHSLLRLPASWSVLFTRIYGRISIWEVIQMVVGGVIFTRRGLLLSIR